MSGDLHGSDGLHLHGGLEGVQKLRLKSSVVISPLGDFVDLASLGADIEDGELSERKYLK